MTICPCCGERLAGAQPLVECGACGARAIGPPLVRPEHELPSYVPAFAVAAGGALLFVVFLASTVFALFERETFSLALWDVVAAGETAAWRLKLLVLPLALAALWTARRVLALVRHVPARFVGLRLARTGLALSACVVVSISLLIGITVPERLRQRARAKQAALNAVAYEVSSVLLQYQTRNGTYPTSANDLLTKLPPDPGGAVARVAELMRTSAYEPVSDIAALPAVGAKARPRRVAAVRVRNAALRAGVDDAPEGLSFTSYKLVLPGPDRKLGTPDDITLRDGRIVANQPAPGARANQSSNTP